MANLKELRLRISSVKNTRKITAAMSQIAAARLRKAQNAALAARPYGQRMDEVVRHLVSGIDPSERAAAHPLLATRDEVERVLVLAMTADKGLCGAFNSNINRGVDQFMKAEAARGRKVSLVAIGNKAANYFKRHDALRARHPAPALDTIVDLSKAVASEAVAAFQAVDSADRADRVVLFYNHFVSVLTQEVTEIQLLPFEAGPAGADPGSAAREPQFEPNREEILAHLVPVAIESRLQQAMFNSVAAEIAARRVAMDSATDNAGELIAELTLEYNRERQAAITTELMEIIGGSEALKG
jgi:F-type H+-transporting ATPase subunit gamma